MVACRTPQRASLPLQLPLVRPGSKPSFFRICLRLLELLQSVLFNVGQSSIYCSLNNFTLLHCHHSTGAWSFFPVVAQSTRLHNNNKRLFLPSSFTSTELTCHENVSWYNAGMHVKRLRTRDKEENDCKCAVRDGNQPLPIATNKFTQAHYCIIEKVKYKRWWWKAWLQQIVVIEEMMLIFEGCGKNCSSKISVTHWMREQ